MSETTELGEQVAPDHVHIVHKETGLTSVVQESTVPGWETAGWTRADNGSEESGQKLPPPPPPPGGKPSDKNEE